MLAANACNLSGYRPKIDYLTPERYNPRPPSYPIPVTKEDFDHPYKVLAQVRTSDYDQRMVEVSGYEELRSMARRIGGDAVIRVVWDSQVRDNIDYDPGVFINWRQEMEERVILTGLVVRFERENNPPSELSESERALPPEIAEP